MLLRTHTRRIPKNKFNSRVNVTLHEDHVNYQQIQNKVPQSFEVDVKNKPAFSKIVNRYIIATGGKKNNNKMYQSTNFDSDIKPPILKIGDPMIIPFDAMGSKSKQEKLSQTKRGSKASAIDCISNVRYRNLIKKLGEFHRKINNK